jgi:hypothetical protein
VQSPCHAESQSFQHSETPELLNVANCSRRNGENARKRFVPTDAEKIRYKKGGFPQALSGKMTTVAVD